MTVIPAIKAAAVSAVALTTVAALLAIAWHLKHPLLYAVRPLETPILLAAAAFGGVTVVRGRYGWWPAGRRSLVLCAGALALLTLGREFEFAATRHRVIEGSDDLRTLGAHFVVGFREIDEVEALAANGLIGGVYITRRNLRHGLTALAADLARLQRHRRAAGLPPLIVAADQEGGEVSHLSPWLERLPPLSSLVRDTDPAPLVERVRRYGERQGVGLAKLGVTLNLAPVVDLRPALADGRGDFLTALASRAIADDPTLVGEVAEAYVAGLADAGVVATLKHFPGLRRVHADTHLRRASLSGTPEALEPDWLPFRRLAVTTETAIMLGHVRLAALDSEHAASHSRVVVRDLLRREWGYTGVLITDDLNMGAVYGEGIDRVAAQALAAGVDLVLVSYDPEQYYRAIGGAAEALARSEIDRDVLHASCERLTRLRARHSPGKDRAPETARG